MKKLYLVTGAAGHLGCSIIELLRARGELARGLILPGEYARNSDTIRYVTGNLLKPHSLRALFEGCREYETYVIHTAGVVDISEKLSPNTYAVNVLGTRAILEFCREFEVKRLVYVSSVHAIEEGLPGRVLREIQRFSPGRVKGGYAKTKAAATQAVLDAAAQGLDAVVVHPSGILGPYEGDIQNTGISNHLVQMVDDYVHGRLPACVRGGYDFVDVRDVARGCLLAAGKGRRGECYILSNRHYEIREVLGMVRRICGGRRLPVLPMWMAKTAAPVFERLARLQGERPLYTGYSLYTLQSNDKFSHDKATRELGYLPRDLYETLADTVAWIERRDRELAPQEHAKMRRHRTCRGAGGPSFQGI